MASKLCQHDGSLLGPMLIQEDYPWSPRTNTGQLGLPQAGATDYQVYAAATDADNQVEMHEHICFQANQNDMHLISDDKDDTGTDDSEQPHQHKPHEPSS
jgi:hypothetical protein